jgi:hypothetical protein
MDRPGRNREFATAFQPVFHRPGSQDISDCRQKIISVDGTLMSGLKAFVGCQFRRFDDVYTKVPKHAVIADSKGKQAILAFEQLIWNHAWVRVSMPMALNACIQVTRTDIDQHAQGRLDE